jgi:uncharacterized lipoprotein YmbA
MTRPAIRPSRLLAIALLLAANGCSLLAPQPDPTRFYLLTSIEDPSAPPAGSGEGISLGLGPIRFPEYLDRPEVVIRTSANQVKLSPVDRWAEPVKSGFRRVLADNLGKLLRTERILTFPWYRKARIDYQVHVSVQRFDADPQGTAVLIVRWGVKAHDGKTFGDVRESRYESQGNGVDPGADAGSLSEVLGSFSRDVAKSLSSLERSR